MGTADSWKAAYNEIKVSNLLDTSYSKVEFEIQEHLNLLKRDARVRVKQWLQKFRQETANAVWKRNRNTHARLLLEQLRSGRLAHPFTSLPVPGPLPTLGRWALAPFLTPQKKSASPRDGYLAEASHAMSCPAKLAAGTDACNTSSPLASTSGRNSMALEAYCGRHARRAALQELNKSVRRLQSPTASPRVGAGPRGSPCKDATGHHYHSGGAMLAGTHMQFASAGASERADPAIVAAGGGSPGGGGPAVEYVEDWGTHSTVALEAALGACREKALELELRLRSAEQRIQSQAMERQQQEKRMAKWDMDRVIDKFEQRRRAWSSPQRREFEDITKQLGEFQRATEQLKKQISSSAASEEGQFLGLNTTPSQQLIAATPGAENGWLTSAKPLLGASTGQRGQQEADSHRSIPEVLGARESGRLVEKASSGSDAEPRQVTGAHANLQELWREAKFDLHPESGEPGALQQSSGRRAAALDEDELADFSQETQALLRQIHAIRI